MRVAIKNEKKKALELEELGLIDDLWGVISLIITSHRYTPERSILDIKINGKVMEIEYEDCSKFDIRELLKERDKPLIGGCGGEQLRDAYGGTLQHVEYIRINDKRSVVRFELFEEIGKLKKTMIFRGI